MRARCRRAGSVDSDARQARSVAMQQPRIISAPLLIINSVFEIGLKYRYGALPPVGAEALLTRSPRTVTSLHRQPQHRQAPQESSGSGSGADGR